MQRILLSVIVSLILFPLHAANSETVVDSLHDQAYDYLESDLNTALQLAEQGLEVSRETEYLWGEVNSLYIMAYANNLLGNPSKALVSYLEANFLIENHSDEKFKKIRINMLLNSGAILNEHYKYAQAIAYFEQAQEIAKALGLDSKLAKIYYNIGISYRHLGDLNLAAENIIQSLHIAIAIEDEYLTLNGWNELGLIYKDNQNYDEARGVYQNMLTHDFKKLNAHKYLARANHNMAVTYSLQSNYELAKLHYLKALEASKAAENANDTFIALLDLTELHMISGEYMAAKEAGLQACLYYPSVGLKSENFKLFNLLSKVHYSLGEHDEVIKYSDMYVQESKKFEAAQEEILKLREQHKIDLALAGLYREMSDKNEISSLQKIVLGLAIVFVLVVLSMTIMRSVKKKLLKSSLENALRDIEAGSSV